MWSRPWARVSTRRSSAGASPWPGAPGTWAELFVAPAAGVIPVPDAMSDEAAAQLVAMPFSAISLVEFLDVEAGDWVVQTAANGAVGKVVAVLAKARWINLLNLVRRSEAVAELAALGIDDVVATDSPDWLEQARAILGEAGARAAVDSVGGEVGGALVAAARRGRPARHLRCRQQPAARHRQRPGHLQAPHGQGLLGAKVSARMSDEDRARLFGELISLVLDGSLVLTSGGTFGLDDPTGAVVASQSAGRSGKIMFRP